MGKVFGGCKLTDLEGCVHPSFPFPVSKSSTDLYHSVFSPRNPKFLTTIATFDAMTSEFLQPPLGMDRSRAENEVTEAAVKDSTLKLWIDVLRELVHQALPGFPASILNSTMKAWIPQRHSHALTLTDEAIPARHSTFHPFRFLPPEIRVAIWELAATRPRRLLRWPHERNVFCTNTTLRCKPVVAQAWYVLPRLKKKVWLILLVLSSKEAWDVVTSKGSYYDPKQTLGWFSGQPVDFPSPPETTATVKFWASSQDLVVLTEGWSFGEPAVTFLRSRRKIALHYNHFIQHGEHYSWLLDALNLETIVIIMGSRAVKMKSHMPVMGPDPRRSLTHYSRLDKIVMFDQADEMERLRRLWHDFETQSDWLRDLSKDASEVAEDSTTLAPRLHTCPDNLNWVDCKIQCWSNEGMNPIRAVWMRLLAAAEPEKRNDADIFPNGSEPDMQHPWVQESLAKMPSLKPAVLLQLITIPGVRAWAENPAPS
jgi:hypothetical protein